MQSDNLTKKRLWYRAFFYIFYLIFLSEIMSRSYLALGLNASFFKPVTVIYNFYYKELKDIKSFKISNEDGFIDLLLLGGSVLQPSWGHIEEILKSKLELIKPGRIRIHNLSRTAHSSLDSYFKYKQLRDKKFDLVLYYHGINEIRANNCPASVFKNDYSHYRWYKLIQIIDRHPELHFIAFPYVIDLIFTKVKDKIFPPQLVPEAIYANEWLEYGKDIKTVVPFRSNLMKILQIAKQKNEPILLMTFSYYVPDDYSLEKFRNKSLDYQLHRSAIEIWGKPEYVVSGIEAHNQVILDIQASDSSIYFVDMTKLMPKEGRYFDDICHFTYAGSEIFVNNILPEITEILSVMEDSHK